jgi:hypothetical protein
MFQRLIQTWKRMVSGAPAPGFVLVRPAEARRCPECGSRYGAGERYCGGCLVSTPEWRFG